MIIGKNELEVLDEQILCSRGSFKTIRRWVKGAHPGLGTIIMGLTGWETVIDQEILIPMVKIHVVD